MKILAILLTLITLQSCLSGSQPNHKDSQTMVLGPERLDTYLPLLADKRVGIVANHSTMVGQTHLVDTLLTHGVRIEKIFSPEHGFRGDGDAGELIKNHTDKRTGLPVISLYGNSKKPSHDDFCGLDVVVFDIQDVGVRFYTYISTMHYVMETCAEMNLPLIVLDRPNPNGFYVDGPILEPGYTSFVGIHPVPIVHGMTIGEFAQMINGEGWLPDSMMCHLTVIPNLNYTHDSTYVLPVGPSPNLPNQTSIYLYPSLGFFEGTQVSIGRGTDFPFQVFGHPAFSEMPFEFTPESRPGASTNPPLKGKPCRGVDLRDYTTNYFFGLRQLNLSWLLYAYASFPHKEKFFNSFFKLLAGNSTMQQQIEQGMDEQTIREAWQDDLKAFMKIREKYLLYPDFTPVE
ncbi:MAG: DUF1343 domain-containing protein [Bacteroidales bacterium]|nr:DUF1343 domain-containing protein [Bacteroidales bacterium]